MTALERQAQLTSQTVLNLKFKLQELRQRSLQATRKGDFRLVATLTSEASKINHQIFTAQLGSEMTGKQFLS
jgi:hypothetical protein